MKLSQIVTTAALFATSVLFFGCAHKPPVAARLAGQPIPSTGVEEKALSFDHEGSDSGKIPGLASVYFEFDQSTLSPAAREALSANFQWLKNHPNFNMNIEGHCDRNGSIEYNLALGQRRAESVKRYLINLGADANLLTTISYGKEKLINQEDTEAADTQNRRANFVPAPTMKHAQN